MLCAKHYVSLSYSSRLIFNDNNSMMQLLLLCLFYRQAKEKVNNLYKIMQIVSGTRARTQVCLTPLLFTTVLPRLPVISAVLPCWTLAAGIASAVSTAGKRKYTCKVFEVNSQHHWHLQFYWWGNWGSQVNIQTHTTEKQHSQDSKPGLSSVLCFLHFIYHTVSGPDSCRKESVSQLLQILK